MPVLDIVARELRVRHAMLAVCVSWWALGLPPGMYSPEELRRGVHAGEMETSVMRAIDPDNVDMDHARDFSSHACDWEAESRHLSLGGGAKPAWQIQDLNPAGACGNAAAATRDKGEATLAFVVERLVEVLADVDRAPLDRLANAPDW